jgi:hypothetical protein
LVSRGHDGSADPRTCVRRGGPAGDDSRARENERLAHTGTGWNPTRHQPIDVFSTFSDKDFWLGLNAAQTTLSAVAQLAGAKLTGSR